MPTILSKNGFRFFFYTGEGNEPAHIHIIGRGGEMKVWLNPIQVSNVYSMSSKDQKEVLRITKDNAKLFIEKWKEWHEPSSKKSR